jgi:hypothetical protein
VIEATVHRGSRGGLRQGLLQGGDTQLLCQSAVLQKSNERKGIALQILIKISVPASVPLYFSSLDPTIMGQPYSDQEFPHW